VTAPGPATSRAPSEDVLGKALDRALLRRIFSYVWPYWKPLTVAIALLPVISLCEVAQPYLLKRAIDEHIAIKRLAGLDRLGLLYLISLAGQYGAGFAQIYLTQVIGQRGMNDLRIRVHRHLLSLAASFFDRTPVGRLMTRLTSDIEALSEMFASGIVSLLGDIIRLGFILVAIFGIDWRLALFSMGSAPVLFAIAAYFRRWVRDAFREIRLKLARMNSYLQEHISGMKIVQVFAREALVYGEFDAINLDYRRANARAITADAALYSIVEAVGAIAVAGLLWYGGNRIAGGTLTIGVLVAFMEYLGKFFAPIRDLSTKYTVMQQAMAAAERVFNLLDTDEPDAPAGPSLHTGTLGGFQTSRDGLAPAEPSLPHAIDIHTGTLGGFQTSRDGLAPAEPSLPHAIDIHTGTLGGFQTSRDGLAPAEPSLPHAIDIDPLIELEGVSFGYRADRPVLRDVSLSIDAGETVAVVGPTGAGKSTIIKLLPRLYEVQSGSVRIGGVDVRGMDPRALRRRIVVVSQDVFMFSGTLRSNIALGDPGLTDEAIWAAARRVGADRVIASRPGALDAKVIERGVNFSGGERQLIAFARALAHDPEILVLDEATASVDPDTERLIERGIGELMRGRTSIVIAHRLTTVKRASRILVVARGQIAEQGKHDALLAQGGIYARLYRLQMVAGHPGPGRADSGLDAAE
jgi:ATP-binding cassette subfamily B multidrug efflux pump